MGTRADFYVGRGPAAEWLGSVAYDGYPDNRYPELECSDEAGFRARVEGILSDEDHATRPEQGWPWPWDDSRTTDYAYAFDAGQVWCSGFGRPWLTRAEALDPERAQGAGGEAAVFPNMKDLQNVTLGPRSGLLIMALKVPKEG
jgi:hypothetical protein